MKIKLGTLMLLLAAALVLSVTPAFAKKPEGDMPAGFEKGNKKGWAGAEVPPGFEKGKKKGWKDRVMPWGKKDKEKMEKEGKEKKKEAEKAEKKMKKEMKKKTPEVS